MARHVRGEQFGQLSLDVEQTNTVYMVNRPRFS
jgi:hypothetical protein